MRILLFLSPERREKLPMTTYPSWQSKFHKKLNPNFILVGPYLFSAAQWNLRLWSRYVSEKSSLLVECGSCPTSSRQLSRWQEMQLRLVTAAYQGIATLLNTRQRALAKVRSSLRTCSQRYMWRKPNSDSELVWWLNITARLCHYWSIFSWNSLIWTGNCLRSANWVLTIDKEH